MSKEVLIVEDDAKFAQALKRVIENSGYATRTANDGLKAMEAIKTKLPSLVLLDLLLPRKDGRAVLRELREKADTAELPVIAMSGVFRGISTEGEMKQAGADVFFEKPFATDDLVSVLRRLLGRPEKRAGAGDRQGDPLSKKPPAAALWSAVELGITGGVYFQAERVRKGILFKKGVPVQVRSNRVAECLGRILLAEKMIDQATLNECVEQTRKTKRRQGEILIEMGAITQEQLNEALRRQAREKVLQLFTWKHGYTWSQEGAADAGLASDIVDWPVQTMIVEGVARMDQQEAERLLQPHLEEPLRIHPRVLDKDEAALPYIATFLSAASSAEKIGDLVPEHARAAYALRIVGALGGEGRRNKRAKQTAAKTVKNSLDSALKETLEGQKNKNHFEVLGLETNAGSEDIRTAFMALAKKYHPDRFSGKPQLVKGLAAKIFARISEANEVIAEPKSRSDYLSLLANGKGPDQAAVANIVKAEGEFRKGEVCLRKRDYRQALAHLGEAMELNPEEGDIQALYGWAHFLTNHGSEDAASKARYHLERAISLAPNSVHGYYYMGLLRKACEDVSGAETMFKRVISLNPKHVEAARELRLISMRGGAERKGSSGRGLFGFGKKK